MPEAPVVDDFDPFTLFSSRCTAILPEPFFSPPPLPLTQLTLDSFLLEASAHVLSHHRDILEQCRCVAHCQHSSRESSFLQRPTRFTR